MLLHIIIIWVKIDITAAKNCASQPLKLLLKRRYMRKRSLIQNAVTRIKYFLRKCNENNIAALSGQSAFFLILSVVPLIMLVISLISIFFKLPEEITLPDPSTLNNSELLSHLVNFIYESIKKTSSGTAIITAVLALWTAGRGIYIITNGIRRIYCMDKRQLWIWGRIKAMFYTLFMVVMFFLCVAIMTLNEGVGTLLKDLIGTNFLLSAVLVVSRYILSIALITLMLSLALKLYLRGKVKLKRYERIRAILPGMLVTTVGWNLLSLGVKIYTEHFMNSSIYGSLGSVMVMMMWMYFAMYILLCGVQLNYNNRDRFSRSKKDAIEEPEDAPEEELAEKIKEDLSDDAV